MHMHGSCSRKRHAKKGIASFRKDEAHIGITGFGLVPTRSAFFHTVCPSPPFASSVPCYVFAWDDLAARDNLSRLSHQDEEPGEAGVQQFMRKLRRPLARGAARRFASDPRHENYNCSSAPPRFVIAGGPVLSHGAFVIAPFWGAITCFCPR